MTLRPPRVPSTQETVGIISSGDQERTKSTCRAERLREVRPDPDSCHPNPTIIYGGHEKDIYLETIRKGRRRKRGTARGLGFETPDPEGENKTGGGW